jgi:acetyl-CoA C-acetyltransferase
MNDERTPILVGVAQTVQRDAPPEQARGPVDMMVDCARAAAEDARLTTSALGEIDSLGLVDVLGGQYKDVGALLAERLGLHPADIHRPPVGGNTPQYLVNRAAARIAAGESAVALIAGAEALATLARATRERTRPGWAERDGVVAASSTPDFVGTAPWEIPYGFLLPVSAYPHFETALRAHYGHSPADHQRRLGELFSRFSEVAATNPNAWFRTARSAEEIATESPENRYVGYPYTKYMNAHIRVDQGAALLMMSVARARRLGVPESRWVYLHGCGDANDHWYVTNRANLHSSPAIATIGRAALDLAGIGIGKVAHIDLYSCFPSAVQIGRDALGIADDDPRPLTVTGGLPYHGGPANNYVSHSIATMVQRLREDAGSYGLCTALGWYITKHSIGIYSTRPIAKDWRRDEPERLQSEVDALPSVEIETEPAGTGTVESYTVLHGRGGPEKAVVVGRLENGKRFLAHTADEPALWQAMMREEFVGRAGNVRRGGATNLIEFD